ncbi:MAG: hypothetical protein JST01_07805 [Cyanobacteria bacterium SZAS TMP-1]|nr:hypothetical protein [Cyanobacteria bacterium SZAS TMP-1]
MTLHLIQGVLFWLLAGSITGLISGSLTAKAINDRKEGRYFHEGHTPIKYLVGGLVGVGIATLIFGQYFGGLGWLIPLFASWFTVEHQIKKFLVNRYDERHSGRRK